MAENYWEHDTKIIFTDDNKNEGVTIHGVKGKVDEKITLQDIKTCAKYFGYIVSESFDDIEYGMAIYLSIKKEAIQRGENIEVSMLDTIPIVHKWVEEEALKYFRDKYKEQFKNVYRRNWL